MFSTKVENNLLCIDNTHHRVFFVHEKYAVQVAQIQLPPNTILVYVPFALDAAYFLGSLLLELAFRSYTIHELCLP